MFARRVAEAQTRLVAPNPPTCTLSDPISIVCLSDTHNATPEISDGDVLIHCGDLSERGSFAEIQAQLTWLDRQPHRHKIVIAGNHDLLLDAAFVDSIQNRISERPGAARSDLDFGNLIYLCDSFTTLEFPCGRRLKVFGSPQTPQFGPWAFQYPPIRDVWKGLVPYDTDILITHGPPMNHLDTTDAAGVRHAGCPHLLREVMRVRPRLVCFGHIHHDYGREDVVFGSTQGNYEKVMTDRGLWSNLARLYTSVLKGPWQRSKQGKVTSLVNAAVAGESKHDKVREPIVVQI